MERLPRIDMIYDLLEKEPNDLFLNYAMALEHMAMNDLNKAEAQFLKTIGIDKNYLPCYYQMGQLKEKLNDTESAVLYYKQGVELAKQQGNNKAMGELNEALWMLED